MACACGAINDTFVWKEFRCMVKRGESHHPEFSLPEYVCWKCFVNRLREYKQKENRERTLLNSLCGDAKPVTGAKNISPVGEEK